MNNICIYCRELKPTTEFDREHVLPKAFGRFKDSLVLHDTVCKECNQYFGDTLDNKLARGSILGAIRYFRGVKPPHKFRDVDGRRVTLSARTPGESTLRPAEFIATPEGEGLVFTPGISYQSISSGKEEFASLEALENGEWNKPEDIDREHTVIVTYRDSDQILERIQQALEELKLGVELFGTIDKTEAGQLVQVVVDAVVEDVQIHRAIAKTAFNYMALIEGKDFALKQMFDQTRSFIREGSISTGFVVKGPPLKLFGQREEAARRQGHIVAIELAADNTTLEGIVEIFGVVTFKVKLGSFGKLAIPISAGHYFDVSSRQIYQMDAFRPLPELWIPR